MQQLGTWHTGCLSSGQPGGQARETSHLLLDPTGSVTNSQAVSRAEEGETSLPEPESFSEDELLSPVEDKAGKLIKSGGNSPSKGMKVGEKQRAWAQEDSDPGQLTGRRL